MNERQAIDANAFLTMILLCSIWSLQQIFLKGTSDSISPLLQLSLRSGLASLLIYGLFKFKGYKSNLWDKSWKAGVIAGLLFSLEYLLVALGLKYTTASHMAVFLYTAPIFAAISLHLKLPSERLNFAQWIGIFLAFAGVSYGFLSKDQVSTTSSPNVILGDFLGLLAGAAWGATTVVVRCTSLSEKPASEVLLYQLVSAFIFLLGFAFLINDTTFILDFAGVSSLAFQTIFVSFASFLIWFSLLKKYIASMLGILSFITPLIGVILGAVILNESISSGFIFTSFLVIVGILLVSGGDRIKPTEKASRTKNP